MLHTQTHNLEDRATKMATCVIDKTMKGSNRRQVCVTP